MNAIKLLLTLVAAFAFSASSAWASHDHAPPGKVLVVVTSDGDFAYLALSSDQSMIFALPADFDLSAHGFTLGARYLHEVETITHRANRTGRICASDIGETARSSC